MSRLRAASAAAATDSRSRAAGCRRRGRRRRAAIPTARRDRRETACRPPARATPRPSIHNGRIPRFVATNMVASAVAVQARVSAACSGFDASNDESRHGMWPQWCAARSTMPFSATNSPAPIHRYSARSEMSANRAAHTPSAPQRERERQVQRARERHVGKRRRIARRQHIDRQEPRDEHSGDRHARPDRIRSQILAGRPARGIPKPHGQPEKRNRGQRRRARHPRRLQRRPAPRPFARLPRELRHERKGRHRVHRAQDRAGIGRSAIARRRSVRQASAARSAHQCTSHAQGQTTQP